MVEMNSFICGDCMDYLPQFPDKYFEIAVVDPEYGRSIGRSLQSLILAWSELAYNLVQIIFEAVVSCTCPANGNRILISLPHERRERTPGYGRVHDCELGFLLGCNNHYNCTVLADRKWTVDSGGTVDATGARKRSVDNERLTCMVQVHAYP